MIKARRFKKMALARYAKQSLFDWGDTDATELDQWFDSLVEIIKNERPGASNNED
jgi:hypothetical protein